MYHNYWHPQKFLLNKKLLKDVCGEHHTHHFILTKKIIRNTNYLTSELCSSSATQKIRPVWYTTLGSISVSQEQKAWGCSEYKVTIICNVWGMFSCHTLSLLILMNHHLNDHHLNRTGDLHWKYLQDLNGIFTNMESMLWKTEAVLRAKGNPIQY